MSNHNLHHDWLALIEISGPFLAVPVLKEAFPQGLEELDGIKRKRLRQAYEEWREALETDDPQFDELHAAWIDEVLARGLELNEDGKGDVLKRADWCAANLNAALPEHGIMLAPDLAVIDEQQANKPLMLIHTYGQGIDLDASLKQDGWAATPADRMVQLCRATGCRLGLVTNGERWVLVDAPVGAVTTFASWYARIWSQEPITLQAFVHLLGIRRFFVDESEQLPELFDRSLKFQDEVTDALGEQVRRAVEVLIQALDKADQDRNRELLHDVKEPELYEAALTVMMRLVFLLSAEERGLLLMGDERYEANYALSTLRMQLRKESEEILERRWDAWSRLLAIFRAVYGGIEHENLRLPALGGSLFDPDRFPFLEGRAKGSNWRSDAASPLPIDNRTVLLLLEAIQQFQGRTLSYRALDVEQIGYVYEGLLERTVKRTDEVTLELDATKSAKTPWVKLAELDSARLDGASRLAELLQERSGSSASRVRNDLAKPVDDAMADRLLTACLGDTKLRDRVKPYAHLLRTDPWGYPLVYPAGAFVVTTGSDRRETGTHYTPKSLTEAIVTETLTPVAYIGPAEGTPRDQWVLKSPAELLDLKICDPAMGSGAFLVQACRWLADRLVEAWSQAEGTGKTVSVDGEVLDVPDTKEPLPRDTEARTVIARRLIAERCLYGVDLNPLAVELAKLSIWLVTLAKGRPFGFLNHNLRCGDSLLGIHRLDELTELSLTPTGKGQQRLFGQNIERAVHEAIELRQALRGLPIRDIHDVKAMAGLDADARQKLKVPELIADAFIGEVFASSGYRNSLDNAIASISVLAGKAVEGDQDAIRIMVEQAKTTLSVDSPPRKEGCKPFHWPLQFPEIFVRNMPGFDAIVGNPPFLGGTRISELFGDAYNHYLAHRFETGRKVDICGFFFRAAFDLLKKRGLLGLLATNTISQGTTRKASLSVLLERGGQIVSANSSFKWPGRASVIASAAIICRDTSWTGTRRLNGIVVTFINDLLEKSVAESWQPVMLGENGGLCFTGSSILGTGFFISPELASQFIYDDIRNKEVVKPVMGGKELNNAISGHFDRWIIDFYERDFADASSYSRPFQHVQKYVRPARLKKNAGKYPRLVHTWWKYWHSRQQLYQGIKGLGLDQVLARARVSDHHMMDFLPASIVFTEQLVVFLKEDWTSFGVLQSTIHDQWARRYASTMKSDVRYMPTDCFETFPLPKPCTDVEKCAQDYYVIRKKIISTCEHGLTKAYNDFHNPACQDSLVRKFRQLHANLDDCVVRAYGWSDINLHHDFHVVPYRPGERNVRFTMSEPSRNEVLNRLLELNRQRYEAEVREGVHDVKIVGTGKPRKGFTPAENAPSRQPSFDFDVPSANADACCEGAEQPAHYQAGPTDAIFGYLKTHAGWHAKSHILAAAGIQAGQWNAAINDLISSGEVERQGEKRGARYRAITRRKIV